MLSVESHFGIPSVYFENNSNLKIKLLFDPSPSFFIEENLKQIKKSFDIIILFDGCEPPLLNNIETEIINFNHYFDYIYSRNPKIYSNFENSKKFIFGSSWVLTDLNGNLTELKKNYINWFDFNKNFKLSNVKSSKNYLPGHKLRHEVDKVIRKKRNFELLYPDRCDNTEKKYLFKDSMFHICIENSRYENYISEKLIDCFMSYTVPIYWGAPNVHEIFNPKGFITFNTPEELDVILDNLTIEDYTNRISFMEENYNISYKDYAFFFDRINQIINNLNFKE